MSRIQIGLVALAAALALAVGLPAAPAPEAPLPKVLDFNRDIRPILSENCFACHGPDEQKRKSKLRLDVRDDALKPAKSGAVAIVPGKADQSELVKRITLAEDHDDVMPPAKSKKRLTPRQVEVLKRWVAEGAR